MISQSDQNRLKVIANLFKGHRRRRSVIDHILEKDKGITEADDEFQPEVNRLRVANPALFGENPHLPTSRNLVEFLQSTIAIPETYACQDLIYQTNSHRQIKKWNRTEFDSGKLDPHRLRQLKQHREDGFRIKPINLDLAGRIGQVFETTFGRFH